MMNIEQIIADELKIRKEQVKATIELIDEGCTIPFIARYRKEKTGALNDEVLRLLEQRLTYLRNLEDKKATVLNTIEEQGKLTEELKKQIDEVLSMVELEDIYRPYKPKRRTRATIAKEKGLEPLANIILLQETKQSIEEEAKAYTLAPEGNLKETAGEQPLPATIEEAIQGAMDIIAENIADDASLRTMIREYTLAYGSVKSQVKKDMEEHTTFEMYFDFSMPVNKMLGYRVLALNRGEKEKVLTISVEVDKEKIINKISKNLIKTNHPITESILHNTIVDSYDRLIAPSVEREIRNILTEQAQEGAIKVFGKNLKQLLMQPPIAGETVLGWDPAFRTGCKLAVVDSTGKVLDTVVVYPTAPQSKTEETKKVLRKLIDKYNITLISVGNGTASRESEQFLVEFLKEIPEQISYVIVNEAGASVYSASKLATEEFPNFDVGQRSAASIARRLQDPLAELVKIDPKSIGVGQYQHDMDQKQLSEALGNVVEDCVNQVGVDLNTASAPLLEYISGINKTIAKNIVTYREENGKFTERKELLKVSKLGPKAYEQCAGFTRIMDGKNPLDRTSVHPESYEAAKKLMETLQIKEEDLGKEDKIDTTGVDLSVLSKELGVGEITLRDIVKELKKPSRDPREDMPKPILRTDVLEMKDLTEGMILKGTVRNIVDFGAFVDIGVHQDGLVHISQITSKRRINHPMEVLNVGDIVEVKVLSVDEARQRIQLSMK
ncbi:MAG: RNA-binding transcriptional accessory protein [Lachnospiraceae bacterium]|nr:RNA-binding transcriptional accessory protein [Lachnospiraceae bacterium]